MKAELYNQENQVVGNIEIPAKVFGVPWKPELVHQVLTAQQANARIPWAHAKDRSEVRGGGRKPWRQKGTGRARHGSIRSPLWRGGGKAHGPLKTRDYSEKVNKKMKRTALLSVLSKKFRDGEVRFFDSISVTEPKTKILAAKLTMMLGLGKRAKKMDLLLVPNHADRKNLEKAGGNLVKMKVTDPRSLNVYDILNHKYVFMGQQAVAVLERHFIHE